MLVFVYLCALMTLVHAQNVLLVNTTQGPIQGALATDGNYYVFYGIHYAGSASGENRFKAPTPAPTYPGVFHATDNNVICAQPGPRGIIGVEDCLTLNVITINATTAKPVVVWLVGENFATTDNTVRSFRRLALEGVVIVQINYRLSIFGFLCLGVSDAPGNAGLKDVVQGLKWIKDNIAAFGGDPNNVILFGHGSGAAMVDLLTMSPLAKDLIHKAVVQSGSALAPWAIAYEPVGYAQAVGAKLGYTGKNNQDLAKLLVTSDATVLISAINEFEIHNSTVLFAPCIENVKLNPNDTFLADAPLNLLRAGNYSHIPYITGYTDREGTMRAEEAAFHQWLEKMQMNFTNFLQVDLDFSSNRTNMERNIRNFYFGERTINMETIEDFLDYYGDILVLVSVIRSAKERAATSSAPVRLYEFGYRGTQNSDWAFTTIPLTGARHGAIINYLLDFDLKLVDTSVMNSLIGRFMGFFKNGVPIQATSPGPEWQPITKASTNYILYSGGDGPAVNTSVSSETPRINPHQQRMTFWDDIFFKYYKLPSAVSSGGKIVSIALVVFLSQLFVCMF